MVEYQVVRGRTAFLNVDMQNCFVEGPSDSLEVLGQINRLAQVCREAGLPVIHIRHVLEPDGSNAGVLAEIAPRVKDEGFLNKGAQTAEWHKELVIEPDDILVEKPRYGAFYGTNLEAILRERNIDTVIIGGIATNVCCDTTAREATMRDFRVLFLSDGTTCNVREFHDATLKILSRRFAHVLTVDEVLAKIAAAPVAVGSGA